MPRIFGQRLTGEQWDDLRRELEKFSQLKGQKSLENLLERANNAERVVIADNSARSWISKVDTFLQDHPSFKVAGKAGEKSIYLAPGLIDVNYMLEKFAELNDANELKSLIPNKPGQKCWVVFWRMFGESPKTMPGENHPGMPAPDSDPPDPHPHSRWQIIIGKGIHKNKRLVSRLKEALAKAGFQSAHLPESARAWDAESLERLDSSRAFFAIEADEDSRDQLLLAIGRRVPCVHVKTGDAPKGDSLYYPKLNIEIDASTDETLAATIATLRTKLNVDAEPSVQLDRIGQLMRSGDAKRVAYQQVLIGKLVNRMEEEVSQIVQGKYEININLAQSFLLRAAPLFHSASKILAVSIDSVSTFWIEPKQHEGAEEYISRQPEQTTRLFVFSHPQSLADHLDLLHEHSKKFESDGAVFVCSLQSYHAYINQRFGPGTVPLSRDFGVLEYDNAKLLLAELDSTALRFRPLEKNDPRTNAYEEVVNDFQLLRRKVPLALDNFDDENPNPPIRVARWSPNLRDYRTKVQAILKQMFKEREREVYHAVVLQKNEDTEKDRKNLVEVMRELKRSTKRAEFMEQFNILDFKFVRRIRKYESEEMQKLTIGSQEIHPFMLLLKFRTLQDLERFYTDDHHRRIRADFYKTFGGGMKLLMEKMKAGTPHEKEEFQKIIETLAAKRFTRLDYEDDLESDEVI